MSAIISIEGIGEVYAEKLKAAGITTTEALLEQGATRDGRARIAETTGISGTLVLRWVNHADLFRINGVEAQYAELLEAAGVDSVPELAQRVPENLASRLAEVNDQKKLVRKIPSQAQVADWVAEAKTMPRMVHH
jgi:predicted flap endonuclease-1-like 5' DNA nuclease